MGFGHQGKSDHEKDISVRKRLKVAFLLNFFFTIIEFIGGFYTNSMAILSDAVHDLGDTIAIGGALFLEKVAERNRDSHYTYGYKRFSTLGALITSLILLIGSILIIYEAIPRIFAPQEVLAKGMMWMAFLGIFFNGIAVLKLRGGNKSLNNKAVMLHLIEDVFGWTVILIGSIVILYTGWYWIDPVLSLLVAFFILYNVFKNLKGILKVFLQSIPEGLNLPELESQLKGIVNVLNVHDVHTWTLDGNYNIMSVHLVVPATISFSEMAEVKKDANKIIRGFDIDHLTISIDFENEKCNACD